MPHAYSQNVCTSSIVSRDLWLAIYYAWQLGIKERVRGCFGDYVFKCWPSDREMHLYVFVFEFVLFGLFVSDSSSEQIFIAQKGDVWGGGSVG